MTVKMLIRYCFKEQSYDRLKNEIDKMNMKDDCESV